MGISDQIRAALKTSDVTRYRISQDTGITQAQLSKFLHGKVGLTMESLDRLADYLGLEVRSKAAGKAAKKRSR